MKPTKRKWDLLSKEKRDFLIRETIMFFKKERDEDLGMIAAEDILDFFLQSLVGEIYNKAIEDAKITIKQSFENLDIDLDMLLGKKSL